MQEDEIDADQWEERFYELALRASGAVQAARWTKTRDGSGYIYSFNGPQSLFVDTIRSCRSLALAHQLGHTLLGERDERISLLQRLVEHANNTARYNIWYGEGRDAYDVAGRTAHESIFNATTRRLPLPLVAAGLLAVQHLDPRPGLGDARLRGTARMALDPRATRSLPPIGGRTAIEAMFLRAARATCDFYIEHTPTDGIPYWDTGAPGLADLGDYLDRPADPFNDHEPVDSSAAAIACQGLLRLGHYLVDERGETKAGVRYVEAGLTTLNTLLDEPYLSTDVEHQGLILHSVYHRPNGWDYIPPGRKVPCGESSMWGDYHAREAALYVGRLAENAPYYTFFGPTGVE